MITESLEKRVVELEREVERLYDVLADLEDALASEDFLGAAAALSLLRPQPPL